MRVFSYKPYGLHGLDAHKSSRSSVSGLFDKKEEIQPIREEPTLVTHDDVMRYLLDLIFPLIASLRKDDAWVHLAWGNPLELELVAGDDLTAAEAIDGCNATDTPAAWNGTGCPILTEEEEKEAGEGENSYRITRRANPLWRAKEARSHAWVLLKHAKNLRATAKARKLKIMPLEDDRLLWASINELWKRANRVFDRVNSIISTADDFREVQGLDVDMQTRRREYTKSTGLEPTMKLPSHVKGGESKGLSQVPWNAILIVAGIIGVAVLLSQVKVFVPGFLKSQGPVPTPVPTPA